MAQHARSACVVGICLVFVATAMPAAAQTAARGEVSAGYQLLGIHEGDSNETFEKGWYADVTGNITRLFGVVFQVSGNYKTFEQSDTFQGITTTVAGDFKIHDFMGGIRAHVRARPAITPFAQVLIGGTNTSVEAS